MAENATVIRCHYDVLGLEREADASAIKKAHRKLILRLHPDKSTGNETEFLAVQQAYECLSDEQERAWYDEHRDAILQGWSHGEAAVNILFEVGPYMVPGCYVGFEHDSDQSFYAVYSHVFEEVAKGETNDAEYLDVPFGSPVSDWDVVAIFYQSWESFNSGLSFAWADKWDVSEAESRRVRRAMEEENKKARKAARKARNDEITQLVRYVKRRDPRVKHRQEKVELEKEERARSIKEEAALRKLEQKEAMEQWRNSAHEELVAVEEMDRLAGRIRLADLEDDYDYGCGKKKGRKGKKKRQVIADSSTEEETEPQLEDQCTAASPGQPDGITTEQLTNDTEGDEHSGGDVDDTESKDPVWRCECCNSKFESEGQLKNHFQSKKHRAKAASLKQVKKEAVGEGLDADLSAKDLSSTKGKKVKKKRQHQVVDSNLVSEKEKGSNSTLSINQSSSNKDISVHDVVQGFDSSDDSIAWRCECCKKDFKSEGQMKNHLQSKKHKIQWKILQDILVEVDRKEDVS